MTPRVRGQNVRSPAVSGSPPAPAGVQLDSAADEGRLSTVEEFRQIVIRPSRPGLSCTSATWLASARGAELYRMRAWTLSPRQSASLAAGANALDVARGEGRLRRLSSASVRSSRSSATTRRSSWRVDRQVCIFIAIALVFWSSYYRTGAIDSAITIPSLVSAGRALRDRLRDQPHHVIHSRARDWAGRRRRDRGGREWRGSCHGYPRGSYSCARWAKWRAIVAATLVLGAVFTPVALLPGTTGVMLRHSGWPSPAP